MKQFVATLAALTFVAVGLAGCLEIDLSRINGNQKHDDVETTE